MRTYDEQKKRLKGHKTYAEQVASEKASRRRWLEGLAASGEYGADIARAMGVEKGNLYRMFARHGVEVRKQKFGGDSRKPAESDVVLKSEAHAQSARDAMAKTAQDKADQDRMDQMRDELRRRTDALVKEGHPHSAAMKAAAYQMGLRS